MTSLLPDPCNPRPSANPRRLPERWMSTGVHRALAETRTTMIRPSFVTNPTTAVHPEGSLKKLGSSVEVPNQHDQGRPAPMLTRSQILVSLEEHFLQRWLIIARFCHHTNERCFQAL